MAALVCNVLVCWSRAETCRGIRAFKVFRNIVIVCVKSLKVFYIPLQQIKSKSKSFLIDSLPRDNLKKCDHKIPLGQTKRKRAQLCSQLTFRSITSSLVVERICLSRFDCVRLKNFFREVRRD